MKNKTITLNNDTYTVLDTLGKGGQASVWKVRRHRDDKELAMKSVLITKKTERGHAERLTKAVVEGLSQRLQSEIDFIQSLPNTRKSFIVPCLDAGHIENEEYGSLPAWVMPLYKQTLDSKMPPYPKNKPIPVLFSECLKWIEQAAIALEATHSFRTGSTRFIHRDVKAANLMLTSKDDLRLIDFGIVRETTLDAETGTHSYSTESAAPEQVLPNSINAGKSTYAIGTHSDMYALGSVFYYLFSGKQSEAQQRLVKKDFYDQHILKLQNEGNTGEIGKVGGLSDEEYADLLDHIQFRFDEEYTDPDASIISVEMGILQNNDYIPRSVAQFIRALLDPVYNSRPSAAQMRLWCQSIKQALSPQLSELKLSIAPKPLSPNMPIMVNLSMIGKGLPADANWIEIIVNGEQIYTGFKPLTQDKHYFGFVKSEQTSWQFEVSTKEKARFLELNVKALVDGRLIQDALKVKINETADDLWEQGKYKQALCVELRQRWLDELHQGCHSFMDAAAHSELLTSLQNCQPKQLETIALYQQKLEQKFNPNAKADPVVAPEKIKDKREEAIETPADFTVSADELWHQGKQKQALQQELRDSWLDSLVQSCNSKQDIEECASLIKSLKIDHPDKEAKLGFTLQLLREKSKRLDQNDRNEKQPASSWKKYTILAAISLCISAVAGYFMLGSEHSTPDPVDTIEPYSSTGGYTPSVRPIPANTIDNPPSIVTPKPANQREQELVFLKTEINGNNTNARNKAWDRLHQLSKTKNSDQAKKMLTTFVRQTFVLAASDNKAHQKQAFDRLKLIAKSGNKKAMKSLGRAYYEGLGTDKNWAQSWALLDQANAKIEKERLELDANTILHNENSSPRERNLAYQAAKIAGNNEASGDPAQKWMIYRYTIGDGVPANKAKAQYWQDVYEGKK
ncbi:MAG: protein kinase [Cocleimonas sp.]|nr:protein kinase [Cocleimonas sp.]